VETPCQLFVNALQASHIAMVVLTQVIKVLNFAICERHTRDANRIDTRQSPRDHMS